MTEGRKESSFREDRVCAGREGKGSSTEGGKKREVSAVDRLREKKGTVPEEWAKEEKGGKNRKNSKGKERPISVLKEGRKGESFQGKVGISIAARGQTGEKRPTIPLTGEIEKEGKASARGKDAVKKE